MDIYIYYMDNFIKFYKYIYIIYIVYIIFQYKDNLISLSVHGVMDKWMLQRRESCILQVSIIASSSIVFLDPRSSSSRLDANY